MIFSIFREELGKTIKIKWLTDSKILFSVIIRNASSTEKRLIIDVKAAREAYNDGIIDDIIWIRRKYNPGGAMAKAAILSESIAAVKNQLHFEVEQSVKRPINSSSD